MDFSLNLLIPDAVCNKDVLSSTDPEFKIPAGTVLTKDMLQRCEMRNVTKVNIKINNKNETFSNYFNTMVAKAVKEANLSKLTEISLIYKKYIESSNDIKFDFTSYVYDRTTSMNPYKHVVNVTNMAVTIAKYYNKNASKKDQIPIDKLALASLLVDVGRIAYNEKILSVLKNKYLSTINSLRREYPLIPGNVLYKYLPDYHGLYSYLVLLNDVQDETLKKTVLLHNERYNSKEVGLGVSLKYYRKDKLASLMAQIIRVCDIYDNLLYEGPKKNKKEPFTTIPKVINLLVSKDYISGDITKLLMTYVPLFRVGSVVRLTDNRLAIVSRTEVDNQLMPTCVDFDYRYIDMKKEKIKVVSLVSEREIRARMKD